MATLWIPGGTGMLGTRLQQVAADAGHRVIATGHDVDITDKAAIADACDTHRPDVVVNCAAYTAVDKAELEPALADALNATAPGLLARACADRGLRLVHISTDYVFDGAATAPLAEDAARAPLGAYGRSKAAGEDAVLDALPEAIVIRTSWLYGPSHQNFMRTMLRLMAERDTLRVVADQFGRPTSTTTLANAILTLLARPEAAGIFHVADAIDGDAPPSWHTFAEAIMAGARARGFPVRPEGVEAIPTSAYPTPARRPAWSVLASDRAAALGVFMPPWRHALDDVLDAVRPPG